MCRSEHLMITSDMDYDRGRTQKNPTTFLALMVEERLFFILNFLKNNPLREYHGSVFGVSQQQRGQWIHTLAIMLKNIVPTAGMLPDEDLAGFKKFLEKRGGEKIIHDNTEKGDSSTEQSRSSQFFNQQRSSEEKCLPRGRKPKTNSFHPLESKSNMPFLASRFSV